MTKNMYLPDDLPIPDISMDIGIPRNELYFGWMRFTGTIDANNEFDLLTADTFSTDIDGNLAYLSATNFGVLGFHYAVQTGFSPADVITGGANNAANTLQLTWRQAGGREDNYQPVLFPSFSSFRDAASGAGTDALVSGPGNQNPVPQRFQIPMYVDDGGSFKAKIDSGIAGLAAGTLVRVYVFGFAGSDQNWLGRYANCACTTPLPKIRATKSGRVRAPADAKQSMIKLRR
jgi:hypothetical protein